MEDLFLWKRKVIAFEDTYTKCTISSVSILGVESLLVHDFSQGVDFHTTNMTLVNPKRPGLFGQLDTGGGAVAAHFRERRLELPNLHFCPQTVFHMKAGIFS